MAGETKITITGNLADDPVLKYTDGGAAVVNFTVIANEKTYDAANRRWRDGDTLYMPCVAWRQYAENIAESLTKGTRVHASGALKQRVQQPSDGPRRVYTELLIEEIGPTLRFASATITKSGGRTAGQPPAQPTGAPAQPWSPPAQGSAPAQQWPPMPTTPPAVNAWSIPATA
ncbi:single-stranded DNA-binding protein [Streptacidiphilus albus]|uniref:single-stranded DNA-binding protein n=1 Tax=Streptacidiphilus albus TaxID=105425 RepID=UPI00068D0023|nr:single-stranded DNA-binding protein [Streptacidiphilus albus]